MNGGVWIASYVMLWALVVLLAVTCVVLLRQIGVLHTRLRPLGGHVAGEGPPVQAPAPAADRFRYGDAPLTVVAFTSPTCEVCAGLVPSLRALRQQYRELGLHVVGHGAETAATFAQFNVASTPYVVVIDRQGVVRGRGVVNSLEQVEVMIEESFAAGGPREAAG